MTKKIFLFIAIAIAILPGCKKETFITGSQLNTFFYDTNNNSWTTSDGGYTWTAAFAVPEITGNVLNNGAVLIYEVYNSGGVTYNEQVPTYYPNPNTALNISAAISVGYIDLYHESTSNDVLGNPGARSYKVVILENAGKKGYEPASNEHLVKTFIKR